VVGFWQCGIFSQFAVERKLGDQAGGRQGCMIVRLDSIDEDTPGRATTLAWPDTVRLREK
jgi:hypothetical protein